MVNKVGIAKSIIYRIYSSTITVLVSYFLVGKFLIAMSIGVLDMGIKIISYYFFDELWDKLTKRRINPAVIWLTGLSGSGKTTIANDLISKLKKKSITPVLLDGDEIRHAIKQHGFDEASRKLHNRNVGYISSLFEKQGNLVVVSLISPYDDVRMEIRSMCKTFVEVYVSTTLETCIQRDPKGLYKKALAGEISDFTGISAPYFPPTNPEIIIDADRSSVNECSQKILNFIYHEI